MIGEALKLHLEKTLTQALNQSFSIESVVAQGGGSINETYQIKNALLPLFLKINSASKYPEMFDKGSFYLPRFKFENCQCLTLGNWAQKPVLSYK